MRHFLLRQDQRPELWDALFVDGVSLHALRMGLPMTVPDAPARVSLSPAGREPSDFLELPCPIVSDAMRAALDAAGVDNVEYIRAEVDFAYSDAGTVGSCWLANVVGAVACAQPLSAEAARDRAARGVAPGPAPGFAIDPARARGFPLFRLGENRDLIVVSARVADALRRADLRGVVLQAAEEYNGLPVRTAETDGGGAAARGPRG